MNKFLLLGMALAFLSAGSGLALAQSDASTPVGVVPTAVAATPADASTAFASTTPVEAATPSATTTPADAATPVVTPTPHKHHRHQ
jgi:hypothetical protein